MKAKQLRITGEKVIIFLFLVMVFLFLESLIALQISPQIISLQNVAKLLLYNPLTLLSIIFLYIVSCFIVQEEKKHNHFSYLFYLILLMIFTLVLFAPVIYVNLYLSPNIVVAYFSIIAISLLLGYFNSLEIGMHTHKVKKEVLAGILIPLPSVIASLILFTLANKLPKLIYEVGTTINPIIASLLFFGCFNAVFVYHFLAHKKHKHLYGWYLAAVIVLILVWLGTFLIADTLVTVDNIDPVDVNNVKSYVQSCIELSYDKDYLIFEQNIIDCVDFSIFDFKVEAKSPEVEILKGRILVEYPITIYKGDSITKIERFWVEK